MLSSSRGGVFSYTVDLVRGLFRKGCWFNVYLLEESERARRLMDTLQVNPKSLTVSGLVPNFGSLIDFLLRDRPEVIHTNFAVLGSLAVFKKFAFGTRFIYTVHGIPQPWLESSFFEKVKYTLEKMLLPFVASHASAVIVISNYVKNELKTTYGLDSEVIYNGIEADRFRGANRRKSKKQLGYAEEECLGLYVAKLHPYKDPLTLVRALNKAAQVNENLRLALIGTGELRKKVDQAIRRLNLSTRIRIVEHLTEEDLKLYYSAADFFVLTSTNEAFGIVLLEAMASGLPIIASDSGACSEVINGAGILFVQGDFSDLANKMVMLSRDGELRRKLAKAGYSRVRETFSLESMIERYWKLYKSVTSN
jgi:glycosyltransferase involved in cell wall biosynthesis